MKTRTNRGMQSKQLRYKVPTFILMFLEQRPFWILFGVGLCIFFLYGPIIGRPADHNGFRYLLGPIVCPIPSVIYYWARPFNPYRGPAARFAGMIDMDKSDEDADRLVQVFQSTQARTFLVRTATQLSAVLLLIMALITLAFRNSLNWSPISSWLGQGLIGGFIACLVTLGSAYIAWGLETWARQNANRAAAKQT
jgi:hypothetical protein